MMTLMMKMLYPCEKIREFVYDYAEDKLDPIKALRFKLQVSKCKDCNEFVRICKTTVDIRKFRNLNTPPQEFVDMTKNFLEQQGIADFSEE